MVKLVKPNVRRCDKTMIKDNDLSSEWEAISMKMQQTKNRIAKFLDLCTTKNIYLCIGVNVITFALMFALNQVTEFRSDDWDFMLASKTGLPTSGFRDIIQSQVIQYFTWGGRMVAHVIVRVLLWWQKPWCSILNALLITALNIVCCYYGKGKSCLTLLMATCLIYFLNPDFDGTCNWITGSGNYVWTIFLCLIFLVPYIRLLEGKEKAHASVAASVGSLLFGVIAGWTNENIAPTLVLMTGVIIWLTVKAKRNLPVWAATGWIGLLAGTILMLGAPGNRIRAGHINADAGLLKTIMIRGYYMERAIFNYLFPTLLLGGVLLLVVVYVYHERPDKITVLFLCSGMISVGAMILSPTYPPRSIFGSMIFFIIAILRMANQVTEQDQRMRRIICCTVWFGYVAFVMQMLTAAGYMILKNVANIPDFL